MNSKLRDILNDFRRQTIVIDNNNSLGGGERGAEAFKSSIDAAEKAIRQAVSEELMELLPSKRSGKKFNELFDMDSPFVVGFNEAVDNVRQKIKQWQGGEDV